jgi:hypothetical protein
MRTFALTIAALLLTTACTDDPEPIEPTASNAAPTKPTPPSQLNSNAPEGAAAFVRHYVGLLNFAAHTGDVSSLRALSSTSCEGCQHYIDLYSATYKAGGHFRGGSWSTSDFELEVRKRTTDVFVQVRSSQGRIKPDASSSSRIEKAFAGDLVFEVDSKAKNRKVHRLERLEGPER